MSRCEGSSVRDVARSAGRDDRAGSSPWPPLSHYHGRVPAESGDRLDSWKEIASYLGRSVRTVRRWEAEEGLPVHRQMHRALGNVYAFKGEIDRWREAEHRVRMPRAQPRDSERQSRGSSIAVLPFASLSSDPENEYFADGLADEVIADLSRIGALRVISRTSSMTLKGTKKDVKAIGRELGVRYLVEGSVRRDASRLRISARLIDAESDEHLWSDRYEGTIDDVFAMQERLARTIVDALELQLTPDEERRLGERRIADAKAYECYLQARQESLRWRRDAIDHAVLLLRNGLAIVGDNAQLYAALGRTHLQYREAGIDFGDGPLREAEEAVRRVFDLDAHSAVAFQLRGWIRYAKGEVQEAVRDLRAALELEPNDPDTLGLLANCYLISGRVGVARPLIARLLQIDPLTPLTRCLPGWADVLEGDFAAGLEPYRQMYEMDPGNPMARLFYAWVLILNGRRQEVAAVAEGFPTQVRDSIAARVTSFLAYALVGDRDSAVAVLSPEIEDAANATDVFPRFLAHGFALADRPESAIDWLTIAVRRGFINYPFLSEHDPIFRQLRGDDRFDALMEVVRERWESFET
jgi:TolB-like protein/thioredoxin-like negative regulator of GroEL